MITCTHAGCGTTAMAVRPGTLPTVHAILGTIHAGEQSKAWCWDHWRREFAQDLFAYAAADTRPPVPPK